LSTHYGIPVETRTGGTEGHSAVLRSRRQAGRPDAQRHPDPCRDRRCAAARYCGLARAGAPVSRRWRRRESISAACRPTPFPHLEDAVKMLKARRLSVSVDSLDPQELLRGGHAGAITCSA
jgi:hypothetical protein